MRARICSNVILVLILTALCGQSAYAQNELGALEEKWKRGNYAEVLPGLIDYRERTGTKNPQIDYMIATSACRTPDHRQTGSEFFSWILYNYNLSAENRATIESEREQCTSNAPPRRLGMSVPASLVGVTYSGKGGYQVRATSNGNGLTEVILPIPAETFSRRLFRPEAAQAAAAQIKTELGGGTRVEHIGHFLLVEPAPPRPQGPPPESPDAMLPNTLGPPPPPDIPNRAPNAVRGPTVQTPNAPSEVDEPHWNPPNAAAIREQVAVRQQAVPQPPAAQLSVVQHPLSISGDSGFDLKHVGADLERYMDFFVSEYGMRPPTFLITVYFTTSVPELQSFARDRHGVSLAPGSIGYSFPPDQSMAGWASGTAYGTFVHELFHTMVRYSFGDIPPWLDEGMAALYEVSRFEGNRAVGVSNWRNEILRSSWAERPALGELVRMNRSAFDGAQPAGNGQAVNHATARCFMQYLQSRGTLSALYRAFAKRPVNGQPDAQAAVIVQQVLGSPLDKVDSDFAQWFQAQP